MTRASWAIVCILAVCNSAAIVASLTGNVRGALCDRFSCADATTSFYECFHLAKAKNGAPCAPDACISNTITYSRCDSGEDSSCDFRYSPLSQRAYQSVRNTFYPCLSVSSVSWNQRGGYSPCNGIGVYHTACETPFCSGTEFTSDIRSGRFICQ